MHFRVLISFSLGTLEALGCSESNLFFFFFLLAFFLPPPTPEVRTDTRRYPVLQLEPVRAQERLVCYWVDLSLLPAVLLTSEPRGCVGGLTRLCTSPGRPVAAVLGNQRKGREEVVFLYKVIN